MPDNPAAEAALGGDGPGLRHVIPGPRALLNPGSGNGNRGGVSLHTLHRCLLVTVVTLALVAGHVTDSLAPAQGVAHPDGGGQGGHRQVRGGRHAVRGRDVDMMSGGVLNHAPCSPHQPGNVGGALVILGTEPVTESETEKITLRFSAFS